MLDPFPLFLLQLKQISRVRDEVRKPLHHKTPTFVLNVPFRRRVPIDWPVRTNWMSALENGHYFEGDNNYVHHQVICFLSGNFFFIRVYCLVKRFFLTSWQKCHLLKNSSCRPFKIFSIIFRNNICLTTLLEVFSYRWPKALPYFNSLLQ